MGAVGGEEPTPGPGGNEKIFVSVRLRPLNEKEAERNDVSDWECINDNTIIYRNNLSLSERSMYPTAYTFGKEVLLLCYIFKNFEISFLENLIVKFVVSEFLKLSGISCIPEILLLLSGKSIPHCCIFNMMSLNST